MSSKVGVRFDRSIPDGNDLGGVCEENHGFFCAGKDHEILCLLITIFQSESNLILFIAADLLRLDSSVTDDVDRLALNELFEVSCCVLHERILLMILS